jgi:hypothetical protein
VEYVGGIITNSAANLITGKGNIYDGIKSAVDSYLGIDRESMFPDTRNPDEAKPRGSAYKPESTTGKIATSVRPDTSPSSAQMVSNRDPKASCIDGRGESTYGSGGGNSGPVRSKPGRGRELLDLIAPVAVATAGVVGLAAAVSGLGMGLYKVAKTLKPVGQKIYERARRSTPAARREIALNKILTAYQDVEDKIYSEEKKRFDDDDYVFGLAFGTQLKRFQTAYGGRMVAELGKPADMEWHEFSCQILEETVAKGNKIHFNLDYINDMEDILANRGKYKNFTTSFELRYIKENWLRLKKSVIFYEEGELRDAPW